MILILQDQNSGIVLEVLDWKKSQIKGLKVGEYIPIQGKEKLYRLKEILSSQDDFSVLAKVKPNKKEESYRSITIYGEDNMDRYSYLGKTEDTIEKIIEDKTRRTHVHSVVKKGIAQIAKKFGEEAVELVIESGKTNDNKFKNEAADVLYYYLILLHERGYNVTDILKSLKKQKRKNSVGEKE